MAETSHQIKPAVCQKVLSHTSSSYYSLHEAKELARIKKCMFWVPGVWDLMIIFYISEFLCGS